MKSISEENGNILVLKEYWKKWIILRVLCIWNVNILFDPFYCSIMVDSHNICSENSNQYGVEASRHRSTLVMVCSKLYYLCDNCHTYASTPSNFDWQTICVITFWSHIIHVWQLSNIGSTRSTNVGHTQNRANSMDVCQTLYDRVAPLLNATQLFT